MHNLMRTLVRAWRTSQRLLPPAPLRLRVWWRRASTRMTTAFAARGTVAMLAPFLVLLLLDQPYGGVLASLGGMFAVLSDTGGGYRRRIVAMAFVLVAGVISVSLGVYAANAPVLLPLLLAVVCFCSGMMRAFGGSGVAIGLFASIMFLVGALPSSGTANAVVFASYYALGNIWVIGVHLAQWRLRPYRVLLQEIAACYDACARLVTALELAASGMDSALVHHRVRLLHANARETIRNAETTLESLRVGAGYSNPVFDRALLLISAVSREVIAATGLRNMDWPQPGTPAAHAWQSLFAHWKRALVDVSQLLLTGKGEVSITDMHAAFDALAAQTEIPDAEIAPLRLALLHMDAVDEAGVRLSGLHMGWRDMLPRPSLRGARGVWQTLPANLTARSIIFRHALRIAVTAGFGLWFSGVVGVPHRLWLPMTVILVLQPEFGATWRRMGQRIVGTLAGVLIAGGLHFLVHDSSIEIIAIALFAFSAFYFIRSNYGIGVVLLTPMILLLFGILVPEASGTLILARGLDTVLGGVLALGAAYILWPLWERETFLPQCATALRAHSAYLRDAFDQPGDGELSRPELMQARHEAERATDSADASLRRMLAEPLEESTDTRAAFSFMTYARRLADNAAHFSVVLGGARLAESERAQADAILQRLELIANALDGKADTQTLAVVTPQLGEVSVSTGPLAIWFERFAADTAELAIATRKLVRR